MNLIPGIKSFRRRLIHRSENEKLDEEIRAHLEIEIDENIEAGMTPEEARYAALRKFGNPVLFKEKAEEVWRFSWLDSLLRDIRYAVRGLRKAPGFSLTVIGTLALGLGVLAASFSVFNAMVLRPFAVRDPYSLYALMGWSSVKKTPATGWTFSLPALLKFRRENPAFTEVLGYRNGTAPVNGKSAAVQVVTGNYFTMLGGRICMGRGLWESDDSSDDGIAVSSYAAWKSRFGADPGIVGKTVSFGKRSMAIVGVACPEFNGIQKERTDFWISMALERELAANAVSLYAGPNWNFFLPQISTRYMASLNVVGRLKPGLTPKGAEAALLAYGRRAYSSWPDWKKPPEQAGIQQQATSFPLNSDTMRIFIPTFCAFGLILVIACVNVSNLILARGLARQREIGIRMSLGCGRLRLIRQLLTESILLGVPASLAAFGLAYGIIRLGFLLQHVFAPDSDARWTALPKSFFMNVDLANALPDVRTLAFLFVTALVSAVAFGLVPAIQTTRSSLVQANRGEFEAAYSPARLRNFLVVLQSVVCTLLLILAGVAVRNEMQVASQDLGVDLHGVFTIITSHRTNQRLLRERLSSLPVVKSLGICTEPPFNKPIRGSFPYKFTGNNGTVEGDSWVAVTPSYFDVYKIKVNGETHQKEPNPQMNLGSGVGVIVSETLARRLWSTTAVLGRTLEITYNYRKADAVKALHIPVIGVAADSIRELYDATGAPNPNRAVVYEPVPIESFLDKERDNGENWVFYTVVRMQGNLGEARSLLQKTLEQATPGDTHFQIVSAQEQVDRFLYPYQALAAIGAFLGILALLLTASGVFGMLSYLVTQRRKEFGVRIALGARGLHVLLMMLWQALRLTAAGAALGALSAFAVAHIASHYMHQLNFFDLGGYAAGILIIIVTAIIASWIPATRAVCVDPANALRCD